MDPTFPPLVNVPSTILPFDAPLPPALPVQPFVEPVQRLGDLSLTLPLWRRIARAAFREAKALRRVRPQPIQPINP